MKLTIGTTHHNDYDGLYFTTQSLVTHHEDFLRKHESEIVVIDQSPELPTAEPIQNLLGAINSSGIVKTRYVKMPTPPGPAPAKNRIFKEATGEIVLVLDCHVLLAPNSLQNLIDYFDQNNDSKNIVQGPLVLDDRGTVTHFNDRWRGKMWGTWGAAWQCSCSDQGSRFTMVEREGTDKTWPFTLSMPQTPLDKCRACGKMIPVITFAGHESVLREMGFVRRGIDPKEPAFIIPGMGMGLFACRRDKWVGFNPNLREFGGEEMYIHEKFRRAGGQAICLPGLPWIHRFHRAHVARYTMSIWGNVRNYVLEYQELGMDVDIVRKQYVEIDKSFNIDQWNKLIADPIKNETEATCSACEENAKRAAAETLKQQAQADLRMGLTLDQLFETVKTTPGDINEHLDKLRELSSQCDTVIEFGVRQGTSTVALLAGQPKKFITYDTNDDIITKILKQKQGQTEFEFRQEDVLKCDPIPECDMLFIDTWHVAEQLHDELERHGSKVKRWIVLHDTTTFGETGQDNHPGILYAMRWFMRENPEWSTIYHVINNNGLTVISRDERDKPKLPSMIKRIGNYTASMAAHIASGGGRVSEEDYNKRLDICSTCEFRTGGNCSICGCPLADAALIPTKECPIGKWLVAPAVVTLEPGEQK